MFIKSYTNSLKTYLEEKHCDKFEKFFHYIVNNCVEFTRKYGKFPCPGGGPFVVNHMIKLIECYLDRYRPKLEEEVHIPNDIEEKMIGALVFSAIWGIGGCLDENSREKYDQMLQELIQGEDVNSRYNLDQAHDALKIPCKLGEYKSLFDIFFDQEEMKWVNWMNTVPRYVINKEDTYLMLSIPTIDSIRMTNLCKRLLQEGKNCLLVGPTGTGKSLSMNQLLK